MALRIEDAERRELLAETAAQTPAEWERARARAVHILATARPASWCP